MVYGTYNELVTGAFVNQPTYNWGASHEFDSAKEAWDHYIAKRRCRSTEVVKNGLKTKLYPIRSLLIPYYVCQPGLGNPWRVKVQ